MNSRASILTSTLVAVILAGLATRGDGASPGLYGGVSYLDEKELMSEIQRRQEDLARASARIAELEERIARLEPQLEESEKARAEQARKARRSIILHDRMARGGYLRLVLTSGSLTEVAVFGKLYASMLERESKVLAELNRQEQGLEAQREALEDDRKMLVKLTGDLEKHSQELEARRRTLEALDDPPAADNY